MRILADYHTHSTFSKWYHARHTIDQMAQKAEELGLKELAITDHGPKHYLFGISKNQIDKAKKQVEEANKKHNVNVLFGIEANLIGADGSIDLSDEEISKLDLLLVGYHKATKTDFVKPFRKRKNYSPQQIKTNTQAYVNAVNKYNIKIITHLNEYIPVDVKTVAEACAKRGTIIELNRKHIKFSATDAQALIESGVDMVISSDAHDKNKIAVAGRVADFIKTNNIPLERIKNVDNILNLKK